MTAMSLETFGQWLRRTRKEKGFTQESLAAAADYICTGAYISSLERETDVGKSGRPTRPDIRIVDGLAKALGEPIALARKIAGYDPAVDHLSSDTLKLIGYFALLPSEQQRHVLAIVETFYNLHARGEATVLVDDVDLKESDAREVRKGKG